MTLVQWDNADPPNPLYFDPRRAQMQQRLAMMAGELIDAWVFRDTARYAAILNELQQIGAALSLIRDSSATQKDQPQQSPETDTL